MLAASTVTEKADVGDALVSDDFTRSQRFTQPRMITLDTRFEGAINVNVWTGYAVLVVSRTGQRRVAVGPATVTLEYDETIEAMELSTGTPKTDAQLMKTGYLRVINNVVSDLIKGETKDLCRVNVQVSYRVNFEGDHNRWFNVENYVKFLTDHLRSVVRNAIKRRGIEEFHNEAISIVRDAVLGPAGPGGRAGRVFEENGMRVYDVDILDVRIGDEEIAQIFTETQHDVVRQAIHLAQEEKLLESTQRAERIKQAMAEARYETTRKELELKMEDVTRQLQLEVSKIDSEGQSGLLKLQQKEKQQDSLDKVQEAELQRNRKQRNLELEMAERAQQQRLEELAAQVKAVVDKAQAISPDLIAALQAFSDQALAGKMAESMAPLAILGGKSVSDVLQQLLKGTTLESAIAGRALKAGDS